MLSRTQWARALGALLVVVCVGCGGTRAHPVRGKVTFEGKPLPGGGTIAFVPLGNQKEAAGEINADGTYQLMTNSPGDGSMPGEFRVVITQVTEREPDPTRDGEKPGTAVSVVPPADRIPAIYSDHHNSPLRAKVEAQSMNELNFDLKRDVGGGARPNWGAMGDVPARGKVALLAP